MRSWIGRLTELIKSAVSRGHNYGDEDTTREEVEFMEALERYVDWRIAESTRNHSED